MTTHLLDLFIHHPDTPNVWASVPVTRPADIGDAVDRIRLAVYPQIPLNSRTRWTVRLATRSNRCGACGRDLVFATTARGKAIPLNPDPDPNGNIRYVDAAHVEVVTGLDRHAATTAGDLLFTSHFTNCPAADHYRKTTRRRKTG